MATIRTNKFTNYERIKAMSLEEMAEFLATHDCVNFCIYDDTTCFIDDDDCQCGIQQWLQKESEEQ